MKDADTMQLVGYHGTLKSRAHKIISVGFNLSSKKTEWLCTGIYFFVDIENARYLARKECEKLKGYRDDPCVITADIACRKDEYVDLDDIENRKDMERTVRAAQPAQGAPNFMSTDQMRCFYCELYKRLKGVRILSYTFPRVTYSRIGIPILRESTQICVSDNSYIKDKRGDYYEYVV